MGDKKMNVQFDNHIPIYIQIVEQLKLAIISKKLSPGERLLSVRELALRFRVNPNTMQRALMELERLKLIYTERTNGKFVTKDQSLISQYKDEYARMLSDQYFSNMKQIGFGEDDVILYLKQMGGENHEFGRD